MMSWMSKVQCPKSALLSCVAKTTHQDTAYGWLTNVGHWTLDLVLHRSRFVSLFSVVELTIWRR
jgi:hypothetical protein